MNIAKIGCPGKAPKSYGPYFITVPNLVTAMIEVNSSARGHRFFEYHSDPGNLDLWIGRFRLVIDPPENCFSLGYHLRLLALLALFAATFAYAGRYSCASSWAPCTVSAASAAAPPLTRPQPTLPDIVMELPPNAS